MQGMMMSERPASIATGMVDSSVSIGKSFYIIAIVFRPETQNTAIALFCEKK
jgi:hypothetical protein